MVELYPRSRVLYEVGRAMALLLPLLAACTTSAPTRLGSAAGTPLADLNIVRADIPAVLLQAQKNPYLAPVDQSCAAINGELQKLDEALGPDIDAPAAKDEPSLVDRGTEAAENSATDAVQRTVEGLIPFRSWLRKLSGAEKYSGQVTAALAAGSVRRAFLKGLGAGRDCNPGTFTGAGKS